MPAVNTEKPVLKALHVTLENKPGVLAKATRALADNKINIEALQVEVLGKSGFMRFYTQSPVDATRVLKGQGLVTIAMEIVEVVLENKPGEVARMCESLSKAGINIESCFGSGGANESRVYLRVDKPQEAQRMLEAAKFRARHDR